MNDHSSFFPSQALLTIAAGLVCGLLNISTGRAAVVLPILPSAPPSAPSTHLNVLNFGAKGDGVTSDTVAFQKALAAATTTSGGAVVDVPGNHTYLIGSIILGSNTWLNLQSGATLQGSNNAADYPLVIERWEGNEVSCHRGLISADQVSNIAIIGTGTINAGATVGSLRNPRGPALIEPRHARGVLVENVTLKQHSVWTLHPTFCQDVTISGVTFSCNGVNSDGIDPDSCARVLIDHCTFSNQDDNIAIKSGKGTEGASMGIPTTDVTITNNKFISGSASVTFGSECSGGIARVLLKNNTFGRGRAGLYFKSAAGRAGYYCDITADANTYASQVMEINTSYTSNIDTHGVAGLAGITRFNNISITNATVNSTTDLVKVAGDARIPVNGVTLSNWLGSAASGITISNATNVLVDTATIKVSGVGTVLKETNVTTGLKLSPDVVTVAPGATALMEIAAVASGSAVRTVAGDGVVSGLPAGTTAHFGVTQVGGDAGIVGLALTTSRSTPPGAYTIVVQETAGSTARTAAATLVVSNTAPPTDLVAQAENGIWSAGGVVSNIHAGFTGQGFVDTKNLVGAFSEVTVNVPAAGSYLLAFRYANGTTADRSVDLSVNGIVVRYALSFLPTGAWTNWQDATAILTLQAGLNKIRIIATTAAGCANYDKLTVSPAP